MPSPHCGIAARDRESVTLCDSRRVALRMGEMLWDRDSSHWVWPIPITLVRRIPMFGWTFCPFCGGDMPKVK